jgi:8-oxo-dGTP pyrophosphatase MutT (NUDIX family)
VTERYIKLPGGGVDEGEEPVDAVLREMKEEIGADVHEIRFLSSLKVDWTPDWVEGQPKRKERYEQFRGEETFFFVAFVSRLGKPTSKEGDAWADVQGSCLYTFPEVTASLDKISRTLSDPSFASFNAMITACIKLIHMMIGVSKA